MKLLQTFGVSSRIMWFISLTVFSPALCMAGTSEKLPIDALIVIDSSGSMKKSDPHELRKPAAKLFINLLGTEDRVSVMSFSDNAYPITYLSQLNDPENEKRSIQATDKVSSKGVYTNIHAALTRGIELLKDSYGQKHEPILVLMSDGKLDVGDAQKNSALREKIQLELIPELNAHHIKVYSIAFTTESDQNLLQEIAEATKGAYSLTETDKKLHTAFSKIFEQSKEPNMLPLNENQFIIDASIREVTLIANKNSEQSRVLIESPNGERFDEGNPGKNMQWFASTSFDMITITNPKVGPWKILLSDNDNKAYIVADVELRTEFDYHNNQSENALSIKSLFKKESEIVVETEFLSNIEIKLEIAHPDGQIETLKFPAANTQGEFINKFKPTQNGIYAATVIATSKTFQRQQSFSFRSKTTEANKALTEHPEEQLAQTKDAIPATLDNAHKPEPEEQGDIMKTIMIFVIGNIVLILIGLNVFFFMKIRKRKNNKNKKDK